MYQIGPFVKWAGGKKQLLSRLKERMPSNYNRYFEPFIGGGALLLDVQALEQAVIACGDDAKKDPQIHWPATPESVLRAIYAQRGMKI